MVPFKDRLEEAITKRQITPAELARRSGLNEGAISKYRKGTYKANQYNLDKLARALNVPIAWLMGADVDSPFQNQKPEPLPVTLEIPLSTATFDTLIVEGDLLKIIKAMSLEAKCELLNCLGRKGLDINKLFEKREISDIEKEYLDMYRALPFDKQETIKLMIKAFYDAAQIAVQEKEEA